jgi:hypothetical protein
MSESEAPTVTHIAGPDITVQGRYFRQRCSWCGAVLVDYDLTQVAVKMNEDGSHPGPLGAFQVGRLIRVAGAGTGSEEGGTTYTSALEDERLPDDSCALLDPEVTK